MNPPTPSNYRELRPPPELAPYLRCLWVSHTPQEGSSWRSRVLPDGCIDIVWIGDEEPFIAGPATITDYPDLPPDAPIAGARFRPGLAPCLLGLPASELRDQKVLLSDVWDSSLMEFANRGASARTALGRLAALESGLMRHLPNASDPDLLIQQGVACLMRDANLRVRDLGLQLDLSERHLRRRFEAGVGYGPKVFGRILRMQAALKRIRNTEPHKLDLAVIAYVSGYADQAHMTRELTKLADAPPKRLIAQHG